MFYFWDDPESLYFLYFIYGSCFLMVYLVTLLFVVKMLLGTTPRCKSNVRLFGKTVIITGGNAGIGKETALDFARRGARVILGCRNESRGIAAAKHIKEETGNYSVEYRHLDLSDLNSVRTFVDNFLKTEVRLDILVNNAGIGSTAAAFEKTTAQHYDLTFGTNHVGHFLLTYLLLDIMKRSTSARIVNVSSFMHFFQWDPLNFESSPNAEGIMYPHLSGYNASKLANIMHARELSKRIQGTGITANSLHPGLINSSIWIPWQNKLHPWIYKAIICFLKYLCLNNRQGAQTTIHVSVDQGLQTVSGKYFQKNAVTSESSFALDEEACAKLWDVSMAMCGLK